MKLSIRKEEVSDDGLSIDDFMIFQYLKALEGWNSDSGWL